MAADVQNFRMDEIGNVQAGQLKKFRVNNLLFDNPRKQKLTTKLKMLIDRVICNFIVMQLYVYARLIALVSTLHP